ASSSAAIARSTQTVRALIHERFLNRCDPPGDHRAPIEDAIGFWLKVVHGKLESRRSRERQRARRSQRAGRDDRSAAKVRRISGKLAHQAERFPQLADARSGCNAIQGGQPTDLLMRLWRLAAIGVEDERPSVCSLTPQRNN